MRARPQLRLLTLVSLFLLFSSACATALAERKRGGRVVETNVTQWQHDWARGAVFYEIFVRSFADSNGDGVGDFDGLISKLDYLNDGNPSTTNDLGIEGIWLMPIFESTSYHGYDTVDYESIERDFGTNADFQRFLAEAHERGIRVIVDLVLNHTSAEHPWFLESASSVTSPRRDWFVWSLTNPGWKQPWGGNDPSWHPKNGHFYYGAFWSGMPDVNYRNPDAKKEMFRITRHWLLQGVDGYRLDATRYLVETGPGESGQADTPETHQVLKELSAAVRATRPEAILVAENTVDTRKLAPYFGSTAVVKGGDEMPMNFNFPLASAIVESVKSGTSHAIYGTLAEMRALYPEGIIDTPFLTNHDQTRIATVLGNDAGKLRNAAAILLTLPGMPFIYYGEELGLQNGPTSADESKRTPMPWTPSGGFSTTTPWHPYSPGTATTNVEAQLNDPRSLLSYYRGWIGARKRSSALRSGEIEPIDLGPRVFAFLRTSGGDRALVIHNMSDSPLSVETIASLQGLNLEVIHADDGSTVPGSAGSWPLSLQPQSSAAWRLVEK